MKIDKENHIITFEKLNKHHILNGFTLKPYNFRESYVTERNIELNYKKIQALFNYDFGKIIKPKQTHSTNIAIVNSKNINEKFTNYIILVNFLHEIILYLAL